jgi:hypothetical protein
MVGMTPFAARMGEYAFLVKKVVARGVYFKTMERVFDPAPTASAALQMAGVSYDRPQWPDRKSTC